MIFLQIFFALLNFFLCINVSSFLFLWVLFSYFFTSWCVCVSHVLSLFLFDFYYLFAYLFFLKRENEDVGLDGLGGGKELGGEPGPEYIL